MEELGQAFVLAKLESEVTYRRHLDRVQYIYQVLRCLVKQYQKHRYNNHCGIKSQHWTVRNHLVVNCLLRKVTNYRGAPWLSVKESQVLLQWEFLLDLLSRNKSCNEANLDKTKITSLRYGGVYRYPTCTDSVFDKSAAFDLDTSHLLIDPNIISWKTEPRHLEAFSHLTHSPGKFRFTHENNNSSEDKNDINALSSIGKRNGHTDIFMNDLVSGLKAAISVLADPRSLLVHGLFDKVSYPGGVFRRSKLPVLPKLDEETCLDKIRHRYENLLHSFITSPTQLAYYELQESLDVQSLLVVNSLYPRSCNLHEVSHSISLRNFIKNIPSPGNGRFALSGAKCDGGKHDNFLGSDEFWFLGNCHAKVRELMFEEEIHGLSHSCEICKESEVGQPRLSQQAVLPPDNAFGLQQAAGVNNAMLPRGPRILNIIWRLSSQLGWTVDNSEGANSVFVDRQILIAANWLSMTLAFLPLLVTLFARYVQLIPATPTSYQLDGLPYHVENKMRFLTERECFYAAFILLLCYCMLGRWIERYTGRDFLRAMKEHTPVAQERSIFHQFYNRILRWGGRVWDAMCPLALQRLIFLPQWNRRNHGEWMKYVSFWRSRECKERRSTFRAIGGGSGIFFEGRDKYLNLGDDLALKKILAGIAMVLVGFSFGSPNCFLNFLTVFPCSLGLGAIMSLRSIEAGRSSVTASSIGSCIKSFSLVTIVIFGLLIGQLVGSSGGVLFLVEVAITSGSLLLGGMGAISASGMETWGTFFCLSTTAFWGYLFGRCSVMENIHTKKAGKSSMMLCISVYLVFSILLISSVGFNWETVVEIIVKRPLNENSEMPSMTKKYRPRQLP